MSMKSATTTKSAYTVKSLSVQLGQEKKKRQQLETEVKDIKNHLTSLYQSLNK